jgi:uncharacterized membrane protein YfcA
MLAFQSNTAATASAGETPVVHPVASDWPAAVGSAAGAILGAALLPLAPTGFLKLLLGGVLAVSAIKLARKAESRSSPAV